MKSLHSLSNLTATLSETARNHLTTKTAIATITDGVDEVAAASTTQQRLPSLHQIQVSQHAS